MKNLKRTIVLTCILLGSSFLNGQSKQDQTAIDKISTYLENGEQNGLSAAILIAKGGKVLFNEAYGMADKDKHIKNSPTTVFDIGSVTKQFTATAILKLEEQGKLKVEDVLSKYFIDLPEDKKNISIHQLLIHSAGIPRDLGKHDFDLTTRDTYFKELFALKLRNEPGAIHKYSNAGYSILARIIELASGQSYESFLNEFLFKPAGMMHTGYLLPNWENCVVANGYSCNVLNVGSTLERYQNDGQVSWSLMGNGGINSTQEDMFKWYLSLRSNRVLSKASTKKLTTPHILEFKGDTSYYAYGWVIFKTDRGTEMVAHDGSNGTFFYDFRWLPEEDVAILYATNAFTDNIGGLAWRIDKMFFDKTYKPKSIEEDLVSEILSFSESYEGSINDLGSSIEQKFKDQLDEASYLDRLGSVYFRINLLDKATVIAELNVKLFPDNSGSLENLAYVYLNNDKKQKALASYKKVLLLNPENSYAKDMVSELNSK